MNLVTTSLLLAASSSTPPSSESPPESTEAPESAPSLIDHVRDYAAMFDTSTPDSIPEPGWKAKQRQTAMLERPVVQQETWTSRKQRRASGDRRTVKQIIAEQRREGR